MDTTLSDALPFSGSHSATHPRVRLPGEDDPSDAGMPSTPATPERLAPKPAGHSRWGLLMSSVGLAFLIGSIGVVGYMQRARFERIPAVREALAKLPVGWTHRGGGTETAGNGATTGKAVTIMGAAQPRARAQEATGDGTARLSNDDAAPVAKLAAPQAAPSHAGASVAVASSPAVTLTPNQKALNAQQTQLAQFEAFKTGTPAPAPSAVPTPEASTPAAISPPPKVAAPDAHASERGVSARSVGEAEAGKPAPGPAPATSAPPKPAPAPADPVAQTVALKAAPMTGQEQLDVIHLVTELGVLVRDQRTEIANLRGQVAEVSGKVNTQLMDFDRRLSIAEAKGAIEAAMGAGEMASTRVATAPPPPAPAPAVKKAAAPPPLVRNVSDYRIQAASPGLAMLSTTLDGGSSVQVAVGDEVPGIGHMQAIFQKRHDLGGEDRSWRDPIGRAACKGSSISLMTSAQAISVIIPGFATSWDWVSCSGRAGGCGNFPSGRHGRSVGTAMDAVRHAVHRRRAPHVRSDAEPGRGTFGSTQQASVVAGMTSYTPPTVDAMGWSAPRRSRPFSTSSMSFEYFFVSYGALIVLMGIFATASGLRGQTPSRPEPADVHDRVRLWRDEHRHDRTAIMSYFA